MRLLDLFSGIGGFSLAASWVWPDLEIEAFVEIDNFCKKVLAKNFPGVPVYDDIKKIQWVVAESKCLGRERRTRDRMEPIKQITEGQNLGNGYTERIETKPIDLLTGGFPCQPFSCAGKRGGTEDERHLWPEMLRAIHEVKPRWVVAENVPGLLTLQDGVVFEGVCSDLEAEGYEVQPVIVPACAQGAPHRRDRVWIVAFKSNKSRFDNGLSVAEGPRCRMDAPVKRADCHAPDTEEFTGHGKWNGGTDPTYIGEDWRNLQAGRGNFWTESWYEVATRLCRVDDGLPRGVDESGGISSESIPGQKKSKKAAGRVHRLRALGNSVVPPLVYKILMAIKRTDEAGHQEGRGGQMKYILHFADGHDEVDEAPEFMASNWFDNRINIESWETWYPEWQGNNPVKEVKGEEK